ncbi:sigma-54-dependent transcriptional regulator [Psychrobacter sp. I-STPA6b]|uniref:sigma-54-dependent transcriptional regulator n=1 Tax=Psychrobacter sp. I-STPA6b TaxID=2585718 RepID=UPI001D0C35FE|nr:sigma-54 dependent transcriptional regulator [Psychrobacter sp. I-STPA6b]
MSATALVIDDEVDLCRLMQLTLTRMGIKSDVAYDLSTAYNYLENNTYDFCLTDLRLPDGSGLDLVRYISDSNLSIPVAVITAHGNMDLAIEALKLGAFDFVNKPLELPRLRQLIEHALRVTAEIEENPPQPSKKSPVEELLDTHLIGESNAIKQLKSTIVKLARSQAPVFLWGESGTGKEVVAKLIHELSPRREGSFVPVNCGAIPAELMESEFFGHKKGSFTGATTDKQGLFQQADGGTLFLDEVADLPLAMQVKLLRAIQEKTVRAIGDTKEVPVDIRLLSATHKDLNKLVQQGSFRQDLFYRINVIELKLPTLNERDNDIALLAHYFLDKIMQDWQIEQPLTLSDAAIKALQSHHYEGNVRELRNLLERAITLAEDSVIDAPHLGLTPNSNTSGETLVAPAINQPSTAATQTAQPNASSVARQDSNTTNASPASCYTASSQFITQIQANFTGAPTPQAKQESDQQESSKQPAKASTQQTAGLSASTQNSKNNTDLNAQSKLPDEGLEAYLQAKEKQIIIIALEKTNWNKTKAAQLLGTSFRSLRYRMKKLGIDGSGDDD